MVRKNPYPLSHEVMAGAVRGPRHVGLSTLFAVVMSRMPHRTMIRPRGMINRQSFHVAFLHHLPFAPNILRLKHDVEIILFNVWVEFFPRRWFRRLHMIIRRVDPAANTFILHHCVNFH